MQTSRFRLDNGVDVTLVHQPDARQAAALWRVDAGSLHEPDAWPGLAHLLEHMLFRGSRSYPDAERLMSWVPAQGGRLNASTRLAQTAYFLEVPADQLQPGLLRLTDMLVAPLLNAGELAAEVAVIDAEYHLLQRDAEKRREAALLHSMSHDGRLARFRIGSRESFGDRTDVLHQALNDFHQLHYHAGRRHLFLQGPQPLETLGTLARQSAQGLPSMMQTLPFTLQPSMNLDQALQQARETTLTFNFLIPTAACGALRQLQTLLHDESVGGLMAAFRQRNLVTAIAVQVDRLNATTHWLRLTLTLRDNSVSTAQVEGLFSRWLHAVGVLSHAQCAAVRAFARQTFAQLPPLEALRERAFGLPPPDKHAWEILLAALTPHNLTRLWASPDVAGQSYESQGFRLTLAPFAPPGAADVTESEFTPFLTPAPPVLPTLPPRVVPLAWQPRQQAASLQLRPAPATPFSDEEGWRMLSRLRMLSADTARLGGKLTVQREQGIWQLNLCGNPLLMQAMLASLIQRLQALDSNAAAQGRLALAQDRALERQGSAIRRLLAQLPRELHAAMAKPTQQHWQAQLTGGNAGLHQALSRLLSEFIYPIKAESAAHGLIPSGQHYSLAAHEEENALLLFLPLEARECVPMQALILRYQPRFFHQMRVERSLGYVAQCQWHRCADLQGVLVALQSPNHSPDKLFAEVQRFFAQQAQAEQRPEAHWLAQQLPAAWRGTTSVKPRN